jgi:methylthioribose-1-phosphate isomerase
MSIETVDYHDGCVEMIDQTLLPGEYRILKITELDVLCEAIVALRVRGAPAIGVAAAYGFPMVAVAARRRGVQDVEAMRTVLADAAQAIAATRPTARNLFMAVERMVASIALPCSDVDELVRRLESTAGAIHVEDREICQALGRHGATLLPQEAVVLTHCNAGALATAGVGTALSVVYEAVKLGKKVEVYADETRPLLQGARLTAWELQRHGVPVTLQCDSAAATLLASGKVDCVVVGADRIAANGDAANKIGTLSVAIAAQRYGVPFYVAAPSTTFDLTLASGAEIPIEQRPAAEVVQFAGATTAPDGIEVFNPAFDVTPAELITALIHEKGVIRPPYLESIRSSLQPD